MIISYDHVETKLMDRDILSKSINFHKVLSNAMRINRQNNFVNVSWQICLGEVNPSQINTAMLEASFSSPRVGTTKTTEAGGLFIALGFKGGKKDGESR